jgi:hypothetical protein
MRGNLHVRFLGEEVVARRPPHPTYDEGSIPFTRSSSRPIDLAGAEMALSASVFHHVGIPSAGRS